jgi:hypothetical protein
VAALLVAAAVAAVAVAVAMVLRSRQRTDRPTQVSWVAPSQLDRADFPGAEGRPWLVAVFSSATCHTCADVVAKAEVLASPKVGVVEVEYGRDRAVHAKYAIDAVPIICVADETGTVRSSFVGPVSATDLWAALAELRDPGSTPSGGCEH